MPNLSSAEVRFFNPSNTDDKDSTTTVAITLYTFDLKLVAQNNSMGSGVQFPDNDTFSPTYALNITNAVLKSDIEHGNFLVSVSMPVGDNDRWIFRPEVIMHFSDGTSKTVNGYSNRIVAQDARDASFVF